MCEQCLADTEFYGEFLPGFFLTRATKDGGYMMTGDWGIVESNDPTFVFTTTPTKNPFDGMNVEQLGAQSDEEFAKFDAFVDTSAKIMQEMKDGTPGEYAIDSFGVLYVAMCKAGYNQSTDGLATLWLCHRLAGFVENGPIKQ